MNAEVETAPDLDADFLREQAAQAEASKAAEAEEFGINPAEDRTESERLDPEPTPLVLESGTEFSLEPLKLRQFLRLLRIITRGSSGMLAQTDLDFDDPQGFAQNILGMMLFALPEAEEESVDFLKSMVSPRDLSGNPDKDVIRLEALYTELDNPSLTDVVTIAQCIVEKESEDLRGLGKRLSAMFTVAQKTGALNQK